MNIPPQSYPTHEFFLSSRSIYLVVFNMTKITESRIEYWLKKIQSFHSNTKKGSETKVFLIGTHFNNCNGSRQLNIEFSLKFLLEPKNLTWKIHKNWSTL